MKYLIAMMFVMIFGTTVFGKNTMNIKSETGKQSYSVGYLVGRDLRSNATDLDINVLIKGIADGLANSPQMSEKEIMSGMMAFQQKMQDNRVKQAEINLEKGKAFLAKNKKKKGVKTLQNGLQYKIIKTGNGSRPSSTDTVEVHYTGKLIDGTTFDSSKGKAPISFKLNAVIKGWQDALPLMKVGAKWELYIPSNLAYGAQGSPGGIGPNEVLIFEIDLLDIK